MITKRFNNRTALLTILLAISAFISAFYQPGIPVQPLEPIQSHYKTIKALSAQVNSARSSLDAITFPWSEYSNGALGNALMRTYYLSKKQEDQLPSLIKCPANSSDQTKADLKYLLDLQNARTSEDIQRATEIGKIGYWPDILNPTEPGYQENINQLFYIAAPIGKWFNPENFPATTQLLRNTMQDIRVTEFRLKQHFKRPRPYHLDPAIKPIMRMKTPAFASGHTLWAFTQAFLFSEIIPEKRAEFIKMAEEVRWSREILGIHFPTDNEASRVISWHLLNSWMDNPQFRADLEKASEEWKANYQQYSN
jgi:acid phosphatase (class A)